MLETVRRTSRGRGLAVGLALGLAGGAALASGALEARSLMADEETLRSIAAVKQGIVAGHKARDRAALERLYADDYTAVDSQGIRTKAELLEGLATGPEIAEGKYDLVAARRWGNVAVATGHGQFVYRNPDGSTRSADYRSVNVFELRGGRWYYVAAFLPD
jgi:ketosteroid isomerase-like protein